MQIATQQIIKQSLYLLRKKRKSVQMIHFSSHSERKKMEKEREENTYPQGHEKEKDLAYLSIDKV